MTNNEERMKRIYNVLDEPLRCESAQTSKYKLSQRNSPKDEELRGLLLQIHEDPRIADFVRNRRRMGAIYDPFPDDETSWTLDWEEKKNNVNFVYLRSCWGMGRGGDRIPFELVDGRFYVCAQELLTLFPKLTAAKLEDCVKSAFREERNIE